VNQTRRHWTVATAVYSNLLVSVMYGTGYWRAGDDAGSTTAFYNVSTCLFFIFTYMAVATGPGKMAEYFQGKDEMLRERRVGALGPSEFWLASTAAQSVVGLAYALNVWLPTAALVGLLRADDGGAAGAAFGADDFKRLVVALTTLTLTYLSGHAICEGLAVRNAHMGLAMACVESPAPFLRRASRRLR
jgi:hypothetical protein